uniref:syntaxin-17-like isoform X2 n=1 Tax=Myxine glutinosa TaxID=7769 RepID=UPI00358EA030
MSLSSTPSCSSCVMVILKEFLSRALLGVKLILGRTIILFPRFGFQMDTSPGSSPDPAMNCHPGVSQQIQASAQELRKLRALLRPCDLPEFEKCTNPPRRRALTTVLAILALDTLRGPGRPLRPGPSWADETHTHLIKTTSPFASMEPQSLPASFTFLPPGEREESVEECKWIPLPKIPPQCKARDSWKKLQQDLLTLSPLLFDEFHETQHVPEQEINFDSREEEEATVPQDSPRFKTSHLRKVALWPVAGAVIGGVVAGPFGLLTGLKVAVVAAALSGGLVGFTGGKLVQKWKQRKEA